LCLSLLLTAGCSGDWRGGHGKGDDDARGKGDYDDRTVLVAATPELDSLALFGAGAVGMVSYAMLRIGAGRRRRDQDPE
jgi:hypothetical protein